MKETPDRDDVIVWVGCPSCITQFSVNATAWRSGRALECPKCFKNFYPPPLPTECSACGNPIPRCRCNKPRVVVCAANRSLTGKIVCGARHWDSAMRSMTVVDKNLPPEWRGAEQGFIDQYGQFLTREEAYIIAEKAGQIKYGPAHSEGTLYSEDLY